ncbi:TcaA second domain-containing protein [Clostridium perfringens]
MSNPQNVIEKFKVSILDKNEKKLIDLLDTESSSLKIDEEGAKFIIDYFNKNLDALDETINYLIRDSKLINKNDELSNMLNLNADNEKNCFILKIQKKVSWD